MDWWTGIHFFILVPFFYQWKDKIHNKISEKNSKNFFLILWNFGEQNLNEDFEFREIETSEWKLGHVSPANHLSKRKENVLVIYHADQVPLNVPSLTLFQVQASNIGQKLGVRR